MKKKIKMLLAALAVIVVISALLLTSFLKTVALADGSTKVIIHYQQASDNTKDWNLWIWPDGGEGKVYPFEGKDEFGKTASITLDGEYKKVGFIVRTDSWEKDGGDRFIDIVDGTGEVWVVAGDDKVYTDPSEINNDPQFTKATIDELNSITVETNVPFDITQTPHAGLELKGAEIKEVQPFIAGKTVTNKVKVITADPLDLTGQYTISKEGFGEAAVQTGKVVRSKEFDALYFYNGKDLGNTYEKGKTAFRVWAPTAKEASLVTYSSWDDSKGTEIPMKKDVKGTWVSVIKGDQEGLIYTYKVLIGDKWSEAVDPYVRAVTVNGDKGVVADLSKTNPKKWSAHKPKFSAPEDAVIYELHVRDLSIQKESGIVNKGKYLGVAETGTRGPGGLKTGLDYMKELGATHIQFLPIYDYRTVDETKLNDPQYNWGYDPKNYNAPEGSYSTNPYEPAVRIKELKQMVQTLHSNDLRVIMDVVYNHVFDMNEHSFNKLVPGYYFRYNENGTPANGTGVGNDIASERKMAQKFIVESVSYWAKEYHMDGFRFDLMGILDVETMNMVRNSLNRIDPSIIVLGEGWDMGTPLAADQKANQKNAAKMNKIAHFNDSIRDGLKGSVFSEQDKGFISGKPNQENTIKQGIEAGIHYPSSMASYKDPDQVVTYAEAHDNHTLWDKLELTNPDASVRDRVQMHKLASSIILTSQGITFIHAGQEFMRTKQGDHNSYKSPDSINQLDWKRRAEFSSEVNYMRGLIQLRKKFSSFRMETEAAIERNLTFVESPENTIAFTLNAKANHDPANQISVIHNANITEKEITLPADSVWKLLVDGNHAGTKILKHVKGSRVTVPAKTTYVLIR